jgi:hypothetical protein
MQDGINFQVLLYALATAVHCGYRHLSSAVTDLLMETRAFRHCVGPHAKWAMSAMFALFIPEFSICAAADGPAPHHGQPLLLRFGADVGTPPEPRVPTGPVDAGAHISTTVFSNFSIEVHRG